MNRKLTGLFAGLIFYGLSASIAHAVATYDATASFLLTLVSVTDAVGDSVANDWSVEAEGTLFDEDTFEFGVANAATATVLPPYVSLGLGGTVFQSSRSFGSASDGWADSFAETDLEILVDNFSGQALTFRFDYEALIDALVSGSVANGDDALAFASVDLSDDLGFVDILIEGYADLIFGPLSDSPSESGSIVFTLADGEFNYIDGLIDTDGGALSEPIPEPATLALLGLGLAGIGYKRRYGKRAA